MKVFRYILTAAFAAALFVLAAPAAADCPPDDPSCHLIPPQSRQVNPDPVLASDLTSSTLASSSSLNVTDFTSPVSLGGGSATSQAADPAFVQPLPLASSLEAPSFDALDLRLRYQDPSDVSCGVQALGMALDGLGKPGPTSSALLGYLQGNGMLYEFGTGVEELAFTAQSFGYRDSLPFHGGTLSLLEAELSAGRPVVADLGAKGTAEPGHFVTVTGISPDGSWVSYNDPILGAQVLSTADFMGLWAQQGYSGVTVGPSAAVGMDEGEGSPAAAPYAPNPLNASPLLLLIAGIMALISNAGLGRWREGIGGMLARGTGGGGGATTYIPPKTSTSSTKRSKSSSKKKAKTSSTKSTSNDSGSLLAGLVSSVAKAGSSAVSDGKKVVSSAMTGVGNAVDQAAATVSKAVGSAVEQVKAEVSSVATAAGRTVSDSLAQARAETEDLRVTAAAASATPQPTAQATPGVSRAPTPLEPQVTPGPRVSSQRSNVQPTTSEPDDPALPDLPDNLLDPFPNISIPHSEEDVALTGPGLIEWGHQYGWTYLRETDGSTTLTPYNWSADFLGVKLQFSKEQLSVKATLPFGKTTAFQTDDGGELTFQQSVSMKVAWNGWNTTTEVAYNAQDYTIAGGSDLTDDNSVSGHQGIYVKEKPYQLLAAGELIKALVVGSVLVGIEVVAALLEAGKQLVLGNPAYP